MTVGALVAQCVGGKPPGKKIYTVGEAVMVVGREHQNHWNSISRSEGDDPTFRESLRIRAQRLAAHTQLPPAGLPTHTNTLIICYLRRVNHFLRPWDVALAWAKMVLEYSKCIFFCCCLSLCVFILVCFIQALTPLPAISNISSFCLRKKHSSQQIK